MRGRFNKPNRSQLHLLPMSIDQQAEDDSLGQCGAFQSGAVVRGLRR